jgi:hypothetical protein
MLRARTARQHQCPRLYRCSRLPPRLERRRRRWRQSSEPILWRSRRRPSTSTGGARRCELHISCFDAYYSYHARKPVPRPSCQRTAVEGQQRGSSSPDQLQQPLQLLLTLTLTAKPYHGRKRSRSPPACSPAGRSSRTRARTPRTPRTACRGGSKAKATVSGGVRTGG